MLRLRRGPFGTQMYYAPVLRHRAVSIQAANFSRVLIKLRLIGSHLGWGTIAVPGDEPSLVVVLGEVDERGGCFAEQCAI